MNNKKIDRKMLIKVYKDVATESVILGAILMGIAIVVGVVIFQFGGYTDFRALLVTLALYTYLLFKLFKLTRHLKYLSYLKNKMK